MITRSSTIFAFFELFAFFDILKKQKASTRTAAVAIPRNPLESPYESMDVHWRFVAHGMRTPSSAGGASAATRTGGDDGRARKYDRNGNR